MYYDLPCMYCLHINNLLKIKKQSIVRMNSSDIFFLNASSSEYTKFYLIEYSLKNYTQSSEK